MARKSKSGSPNLMGKVKPKRTGKSSGGKKGDVGTAMVSKTGRGIVGGKKLTA